MKSGTGTKASRAVGRHYEELAAKYLEKAGYHILSVIFSVGKGKSISLHKMKDIFALLR